MENALTKILNELTNEELNEAFDNITELQTKGELGNDNVFRRLKGKIEKELNTTYSMHGLEREILYLIAKRAYPLTMKINVWECPDCNFKMVEDQKHVDSGGQKLYGCPVCELERLNSQRSVENQ